MAAAFPVNEAATAAMAVVSCVPAAVTELRRSLNSCLWKMAASASRQIRCIMETALVG